MKVVITGANGFVGQELAKRLLSECDGVTQLTLVDIAFAGELADPRIRYVKGNLQEESVRQQALDGGVDGVVHLAAVPGGAAEQNYPLSKSVNVDATLDLMLESSEAGECPVFIYASSIAVFGAPLPDEINDSTQPRPAMIYGTHKLMMELALADFSRRKKLQGLSLRLPGIVPRPRAPSGMKAAFMSNVFHALAAGERFESPVSKDATMWLMSVKKVAENLQKALFSSFENVPGHRVVTLPVVRVSMGGLCNEIQAYTATGGDVTFSPDMLLEAQFGSLPPLTAPLASALGFKSDGDVKELVNRCLDTIGAL